MIWHEKPVVHLSASSPATSSMATAIARSGQSPRLSRSWCPGVVPAIADRITQTICFGSRDGSGCGCIVPAGPPCLHQNRDQAQAALWGPSHFFSAWVRWLTLLGGHCNLSYQSQKLYHPAFQQRNLPLWTLFWIICLHLWDWKAS